MCEAMRNLCRLDEARLEVLAFDARNRDQRRLRARLLEQMDMMERHDCRPGRERAFDWMWDRVEQMRIQLESPEMAWRPWWISRVSYGLWEWVVGVGWRLLDRWRRMGDAFGGVRERVKAARWAIEARLW